MTDTLTEIENLLADLPSPVLEVLETITAALVDEFDEYITEEK